MPKLQLVPLPNDSWKINSMIKKHMGDKYKVKDGAVLELGCKLKGYALFYPISKKTMFLDWIYAIGYGETFMKRLERKWKREGYEQIQINVSVDPTEKKSTVIHRLNFWYRMKFETEYIKYRKKYGPLLKMIKEI